MTRRRQTTAADWMQRVERAVDHLRGCLDRPVSLDELARVGAFSPFHFHRVWKSVTGETVHQTTTRLRLEQAAARLRRTDASITDIAVSCGLGSAELSRAFRAHFGLTPSAFRKDKRALKASSLGRDDAFSTAARRARQRPKPPVDVRIRSLSAVPTLYVRAIDPYAGQNAQRAMESLEQLIRSHPRVPFGRRYVAQLDDPDVTPRHLVRTDFGVEAPADWVPSTSNVMRGVLSSGKWACVEHAGSVDDFVLMWDALFEDWLPASGYQPGSEAAVEIFLAPPSPNGHFHVEMRMPLEGAGR